MYNTYQYNTNVYNTRPSIGAVAAQDDIVFNGYSLQSSSIVSSVVLHDSTPDRNLIVAARPRSHGQNVIDDFYRKKIIRIRGTLRKTTSQDFEAELDVMKKNLSALEADLDIKIDGVIRRYKATLINGDSMFNDRQHYHITFVPFTLEFECSEPFGNQVNLNEESFLDQTVLNFNMNISNDGTVETPLLARLFFNTATAISKITLTNLTNSQAIEITQNIANNDIIFIDGENKEVRKNGALIDYSGVFPKLPIGASLIGVDITGTSSQYSLVLQNKISYL